MPLLSHDPAGPHPARPRLGPPVRADAVRTDAVRADATRVDPAPAGRALALLLALLAAPAGGGQGPAAQAPRRPNVLFLLADDQAHDTLSAAGHPVVQTPGLDRLAAEGVHFTRAFATTALCSPSRASFYTGQYARTHGVLHNAVPLLPDAVTFPRLLQAAGYDTAFVGKWHVGQKGEGGRLPGFDEVTAYKAQGRYLDNVFRRAGERVPTEGFVDDRVTDFAIEFMSREREAPFLVCVGFKSAHRPRTPAPRHAELYAEAEFEPPPSYASLPPFPRRTEWAELSRRAGERVLDVPDEDWAEDYGERWPMVLARDRSEEQRDYLRLVTALDENVSRLLAALDELGLSDDTLVVYASDHGFLESEHGLNGKGTAYEGSMRTVLLMRYPRFAPRGAEPRLALSVDVAPTVLELAGIERPEGLEGRSLVPLLRGDDELDWRQDVLYEFYQGRMYGGFPTTLAVRGEHHKLITYPGYPSWTELYDLETDPHEMVDLADEAEHAELRAHMERRLEALEAELGGARPVERPSKDTPARNRAPGPRREPGRDADQDE